MRNKAKTWGVIGNTVVKSPPSPGVMRHKNAIPKSQLQTVLITASGPQALNALVHRERYTQGSRQNRCVSSQEALALRANVTGKGEISVHLPSVVLQLLYCDSLTLHSVGGGSVGVKATFLRRGNLSPRGTPRLRLAVGAKNCQLRTAYGGESNCVIKT